MIKTSKLAIALAVVLGAGSAALAAPRHPVHHYPAPVHSQLSGASAYAAAARRAYAAEGYGQRGYVEPEYMHIQTQGYLQGD
jgi:hypothetical protein